MNINVISLFPELVESSFKGLTGKALRHKIAELNLVNLKFLGFLRISFISSIEVKRINDNFREIFESN